MNIANLTSMSDFKTQAVERWVKTYDRYIDKTNLPADASNMARFMKGELVKGNKRVNLIAQQAETQRKAVQSILGWKTDFDLAAEQHARDVANWVMGPNPESVRHKLGYAVTNWWETENPLMKLRGWAFDMKLGLFNPAQLALQGATMFSSALINPRRGLDAMVHAPFLRAYLTKGGEHLIEHIAQDTMMAEKLGFEGPEELAHMWRSAKDSGFFDVGAGTHQFIQSAGPNVFSSGWTKGVKTVREHGRWFFNEGEAWNRSVAWHMAWKTVKEEAPRLSWKSNEFLTKVAGRAEDFSFNMGEASKSWWQRGVLSVPTQFWAYNARVMEAIFGKQFSLEQKARLVIGQFLLYGTAGVPILSVASELGKNHNPPGQDGKNPLDTLAGAFDRGLLDEMLYHTTGADLQLGKRFGTASWSGDLIKGLFGWNQYGDKSLAEMGLGATGAIVGTTGKTFIDLVKYATAEGGGNLDNPLSRDAALKLASNISTLSNGLKAYMVFKYGTYQNNSGSIMADDVPKQDAWGVLVFGAQPGEIDQLSAMMGWMKDRKKSVDEASKVLIAYRQQYAEYPDKADEIREQINLFVKLLPPDIKRDVLIKTQHNTPQSVFDSVNQSFTKKRAQEEAMIQMQKESANYGTN
jgi:hypothetical protein